MIFEKMKKLGLLCCLIISAGSSFAQSNIVLVTLDGFRWQELYQGADSILLKDNKIYWHNDESERRKMLMPFFWSEIADNGQLLGNRNYKNRVDCDNPHWFSYPGYNEMLTGFIDRKVKSNDKIENPNMTVFEYISNQPGYENRVAAFGTWGVFPYIFRENTSRIFVNAGDDEATGEMSEREKLLNELQQLLPNPVTERHDVFTAYFAMEYMKREHPKAVFIGLDETDSYAHGGMYDQYLHAAHRSDEIIKRLWTFIQTDPGYRNNTTLIITTDHGRGRGYWHEKLNWRSHGRLAFGSGEVWVAALGPGIEPVGENQSKASHTLGQVASTIAASLRIDYSNRRIPAPAIDGLLIKEDPLSAKSNK
jgi:hypothetical protein